MLDSVVLDDHVQTEIESSNVKTDIVVNVEFDDIKKNLSKNSDIKVCKDRIIVYKDNVECTIQAKGMKNREGYLYLEGAKYKKFSGDVKNRGSNTWITATVDDRSSELALYVGNYEYS